MANLYTCLLTQKVNVGTNVHLDCQVFKDSLQRSVPRQTQTYWNATGNGWDFPIDRAEARIRLPAAVKLGQRSVYTGAQGSTASNAAVVAEKPGEILFRTTRPLASYEGLTVAVIVFADREQPPKVITIAVFTYE